MAFGPGMCCSWRFPERQEGIPRLEERLKGMQAEAKALEERITERETKG